MAAQFNLAATRNTFFSGAYSSLALATAAGSTYVALGYDVAYTFDGTDFFINASLYESFYGTYLTEAAANAAASPYISSGYHTSIHETTEFAPSSADYKLQYSPSKYRIPSLSLDGAYFSPTLSVAVFVYDPFDYLGITSVDFKLDTVLVNTEGASPWDYAMTDGFGDANRVTFSAGLHTIEADVTATTGNFTISANFEVE